MQNKTFFVPPSFHLSPPLSLSRFKVISDWSFPFVEDIVSKALSIRSGFVARPGLRSRYSSTKARGEVASGQPTLKAGAKKTILHAEWYHRRSLGTAFKTAFVYDPMCTFLHTHARTPARMHARTYACRSRCTLKLAISTTRENEEGTTANERAGTVTGEGNSSHRNQTALCQRQNGRNSIGRGSSTREDQFPRHNDALVSNGAGEKRASLKNWDSNTRANA